VRVIELPGIGPLPFGCMLLADLGAEVIRVDRPVDVAASDHDDPIAAALSGNCHLMRGRRRIGVDLKAAEGAEIVRRLASSADVLAESFRPGVAERLGVGPAVCREANPRLVYARLSGWGQTGPLSAAAGHDINYLALSGALHGMRAEGREGPPSAPVGHAADFGGGGMLFAVGVLAALLEREHSGEGQIIDVAVLDGALLVDMFARYLSLRAAAGLRGESHFYRAYETADERWVSFGALERPFHDELIQRLGLDPSSFEQHNRACWPAYRETVAEVVRAATCEQWRSRMEGSDACFAPVLSPAEAPSHPHHRARRSFVKLGGELQAAPSPRFERTPAGTPSATRAPAPTLATCSATWTLTPRRSPRCSSGAWSWRQEDRVESEHRRASPVAGRLRALVSERRTPGLA
jgi:alpha-methylacyl-CoA racemase